MSAIRSLTVTHFSTRFHGLARPVRVNRVIPAFPLVGDARRHRDLCFIPVSHHETVVDSDFARQLNFPAKNNILGREMMSPRLVLALAALLLAGSSSVAQDYPSRPVRIIVPFGAGGPADVTARQLGNILQENFGQPFVVENRTGAGGVIGTVEAAKSPPDGYTLLMMSNTQTANESLVPKRNYELMRDLAPIAPVNYSDLVIVVHPSVQARTLAEFIALAKSQPGKLNY